MKKALKRVVFGGIQAHEADLDVGVRGGSLEAQVHRDRFVDSDLAEVDDRAGRQGDRDGSGRPIRGADVEFEDAGALVSQVDASVLVDLDAEPRRSGRR